MNQERLGQFGGPPLVVRHDPCDGSPSPRAGGVLGSLLAQVRPRNLPVQGKPMRKPGDPVAGAVSRDAAERWEPPLF